MDHIRNVLASAKKSGLTKVVIRLEGNYEWLTARLSKNGKWEASIIPARHYCPVASTGLKVVQDPIPPECYVKHPKVKYGCRELDRLVDNVAREVRACETLAKNPHPNIAKYHGCIVRDGLVKGICYTRYKQTLSEKVNPGRYSKWDFQYSHVAPLRDRARFLDGVGQAVAHLHSLGLVHNDIKPGNIMLTADETPVLIDFDSCLPVNEPPDGSPATKGWYDPEIRIALFSNDIKAVDEIRKWLSDDKAKGYYFQCLPDSCF